MSDMTRSGHRQFIEAGERKYQERKGMANVKTVTDRDKGALLHLEDGSAPVWTPDKELARTLLGKPIPEDWTRREGPYGPQALPPRPKGAGGMVAWRNTKEGFEAEAAGRRRWQEIEEEKKDRRTALMQAVRCSLRRPARSARDLLRMAVIRPRRRACSTTSAPLGSSPAAGPAATREGRRSDHGGSRAFRRGLGTGGRWGSRSYTRPGSRSHSSVTVGEVVAEAAPGGQPKPPGVTTYP